MKTKDRVPKLRFPGFTGNWEQRKVGDLFSFIKTKNNNNDVDNVITNSAEFGLIPQRDFFDKDIAVEGHTSNYTIIQKGDFVYNPRKSNTAPYGPFNCYTLEEKGIVSPLYTCLSLETKDYTEYLLWYFKTDNWHLYIKANGAQGGARHDRVGMTSELMNGIPVSLPSYLEQKKIASFLSTLEEVIALHQRKVEQMKEYKKGMLQKMFPKKGERVPEIRFPGFTGDWEQRTIGEICQRVMRKNKNSESDLPLTISSQDGLIDQRTFFGKVVAAKDMSNYYLLKNGEFAYNKSYSKGYDYGSIKRLNAYEMGCLSTLYICFALCDSSVESDYLERYFDTLLWYEDIAKICAEGARNHGLLNVDTKAFFDSTTIHIPKSIDEQKQIAEFFNKLDNTIILYQRKLEQMKEYKKGLLQQMFV